MREQPKSYGALHLGFLLVSGLLGWVLTLTLFFQNAWGLRPAHLTWEFFACAAMAIVARVWAVRVFREVRIALDSAFYVAISFVFGIVTSALMICVILSGDALVQLVRSVRKQTKRTTWTHRVVTVIHQGGLPAFVLLGTGIGFQVDSVQSLSDLALTLWVPAFSLVFLSSFYFLAGGAQWFEGTPVRTLARRYFPRVVTSEFALVPLALAMVLGYIHQGIGLFLLLGFTCLVFNVIFRRSVIAGEKLRTRVEELYTLNRISHQISGTLERRALLRIIAESALKLIGKRSRLTITIFDSKSDTMEYELFDEQGTNIKRGTYSKKDDLVGWVLKHRQPLLLSDARSVQHYVGEMNSGTQIRSWMGVPLLVYDEVIGVMSVESAERNAYSHNHLRFFSTIADQAAVALENARLYELATVDGLTGLLVRRHFDQRLQEEWSRCQRYGGYFSVGIFDLDNFKKLNDTYGHHIGDQILRAASAVVRNNMRGADLAGRYGGEEFAFILPGTRIDEAHIVAERIRSDIASMKVDVRGVTLNITTTIGIAAFPDAQAADAQQLLALADQALYEGKRTGKNQVRKHLAGAHEIDVGQTGLG